MKIRIILLLLIGGLRAATCGAQQAENTRAENPPRNVEVELVDGSHLAGTLPPETTFPVQSPTMQANIAIKWVDTILISDDRKTAVITMQNGDRIQGTLDLKPLPLTTVLGKMEIAPRFLRTLTVFAPGGAAAEGLVFWDTLASEKEALHSTAGPALVPYAKRQDAAVPAGREYIGGEHGAAMTIKGSYVSEQTVRNLVLGLDKLINPEQGCIELWYCQQAQPVGYSYGVYRMFDGDYGLNGCAQFYAVPGQLVFQLNCGGKPESVVLPIEQVPDKKWVHLAAVWNRKGIEGTQDTMRIYLNGKLAASGTAADWGAVAAGEADICGGNDDCAGKFMMYDLKIWNRAKTNFETTRPPDIDPARLPPIRNLPQNTFLKRS